MSGPSDQIGRAVKARAYDERSCTLQVSGGDTQSKGITTDGKHSGGRAWDFEHVDNIPIK